MRPRELVGGFLRAKLLADSRKVFKWLKLGVNKFSSERSSDAVVVFDPQAVHSISASLRGVKTNLLYNGFGVSVTPRAYSSLGFFTDVGKEIL